MYKIVLQRSTALFKTLQKNLSQTLEHHFHLPNRCESVWEEEAGCYFDWSTLRLNQATSAPALYTVGARVEDIKNSKQQSGGGGGKVLLKHRETLNKMHRL